MSDWTHASVCAALGIGTDAEGDGAVYTGISTDTRALVQGQLFVALAGQRFDAHDYLAQAEQAGATAAVVHRVPDDAPATLHYYVVEDTLRALGRLGRFHRRRMGWTVVAVAGANGKTTTKDLLRAALSPKYRVHATTGNLNNLVGAPLTLLAAPDSTEVVVSEIGTNMPGEVARLAGIVEPDVAVITSIAAEHLEGLGDLEGVLREETSVLPWLSAQGLAVVPDDPTTLAARARALVPRVVVVGTGKDADAEYRAANVRLDENGAVRFDWQGRTVSLQLRGRHNARNALLALAVAHELGVDGDAAIQGMAQLAPAKMRGEFHHYGGMTVIADCYNANPASVQAAVDLLVSLPRGGGRVAVLGTMRELGEQSEQLHEETAADVAASDVDLIVATGDFESAFDAHAAALGERLIRASDPLEAYERFAGRLQGDEIVLLKGSRGVALERLLPRFEEQWGVLHPHGEAFGSRAIGTITGERDDALPAEHPRNTDAHERGKA
ncbi:MAG: UDP-N-acetylmuramoyl-tripeptide--D-alanyl-D-alanine ligase [Longimicrobiales bacterium]